jgi:nicotinamidase-related amidase
MDRTALIVVDVQRGFDDAAFFGHRNNTACEENVRALIAAWRGSNQPVVFVRHHWDEEGSPLRSDEAGSEFKDVVEGRPDLLVTKTVNSAFHGTPDLQTWLRKDEIDRIVVCGITTNHCCETTARMGGNLGYDVRFVIDATHTFDRGDMTADQLAHATATNLDGEFARIVTTREVLDA